MGKGGDIYVCTSICMYYNRVDMRLTNRKELVTAYLHLPTVGIPGAA